MYILIAGDSDPDYSRAYGPFETQAEAYAQAPEDSDDTRWRALEIRPIAEIRKDDDYDGEDDADAPDAPATAPAAKPEARDTRPLEEQMLELIQRHGGLHDIPAPNATVHQWSEWKLRRLGEYNIPIPEDVAKFLFAKETSRQKAAREFAAAENERELRIWRGLRDAHKPVVAQAAPAPVKKPRKPSAAQLAQQARRELNQRVHALTQLYRGVEGIPAPNADVYKWVQAKLADMGEDGHPVSQGISDLYFGKPPHTVSGRKLKQAEETLATERARWYPLRDKHAPQAE